MALAKKRNTNQPPSHLTVVFASNRWMKKDDVLNAGKSVAEDMMLLCRKGEEKTIIYPEANALIIAQNAVEKNLDNEETIEAIRDEAKAEAAHDLKIAKAPKPETLDEKIERLVTGLGDTIGRALGLSKKAA
jgi:hypothetical protein